MFKKRRAQSTLEYVLVLTAIIAAIIVGAMKFVKPKVESSLEHVSSEMENAVNKIKY
ncbi:MAG TPA: hypothetical protein VI976_00840 [Candidatus Omnitrophota bacterium]|nr:hypothetical protein [Candidatus Omnitrophota bacterium]